MRASPNELCVIGVASSVIKNGSRQAVFYGFTRSQVVLRTSR